MLEGDPILVLRQLSGHYPMIPIPGIDALDRVDPFDRVFSPIQGLFENERIHDALYIGSRNHDDEIQ